MTSDGSGEWFSLPDGGIGESQVAGTPPERLDSLMPSDGETGVVRADAFRVCLGAFIDLMERHGQPLTLLTVAADPSDTLSFLGKKGTRLIGGAIARWLRQETRVHDVIGMSAREDASGPPVFVMICPLMTESVAAAFAERLRESMTLSSAAEGSAWLTLSVGVAALSLDTHSPEALILRAEEALAGARRSGGGRVWSHSDSVRRIVDRNQPDPPRD